MKQYTFSVIIPVFNKWELTRACLTSLREHTGRDDFEVLVVDNASSDATLSELEPLGQSLFGPAFTAIRNPVNINFGPACNRGAERAAAPLLFFLNNDTLLTPGWYEPLQSALDDAPNLGAAGPLLLYENNTVQHLGVAFSVNGLSHLYAGFLASHPVVARPRSLQAITGAALLLPRELFFACGAFYEGYSNGFEDVELCLRIRQAGKSLSCVPASRIFHLESQSAGRHGSNDHNEKLLKERCGLALRPDFHLHGARDGFQVVVNDALGQSLLVPPEQDAELRARISGKTYDAMYAAVCENPYWLWGNETLGQALESAGHYAEAAYFYAQIFKFYPSFACAKKLLRLGTKAGLQELIGPAEQQVREFAELAANPQGQLSTVREMLRTAERLNDELLFRIYNNKLAAMSKQAGA